jgi:hypothetical protein
MKLTTSLESFGSTVPTTQHRVTTAGLYKCISQTDQLMAQLDLQERQEEQRDLAIQNLQDLKDTLQQYPDQKDLILSLANADKGLETALRVPNCNLIPTPELLKRIEVLLDDAEVQIEHDEQAAIAQPEVIPPPDSDDDLEDPQADVMIVETPVVEPEIPKEEVPAKVSTEVLDPLTGFALGYLIAYFLLVFTSISVGLWQSAFKRLMARLQAVKSGKLRDLSMVDESKFAEMIPNTYMLAKPKMDKVVSSNPVLGKLFEATLKKVIEGKVEIDFNAIASHFSDIGMIVNTSTGSFEVRPGWSFVHGSYGDLGFTVKSVAGYYRDVEESMQSCLRILDILSSAKRKFKDAASKAGDDKAQGKISSAEYSAKKKELKQSLKVLRKLLKHYISNTKSMAVCLLGMFESIPLKKM